MSGDNKPDLVDKAVDKTIDVVADLVETWVKKKIAESPSPAPEKEPHQTAPPVSHGGPSAHLLVVKGGTIIREQTLSPTPLMLGRNELDPQDRTISRQHAQFFFRDGYYWVADYRSDNGTFVNGERISAPHALRNGDRVRIGESLIVFVSTRA